MSQTWNTGQNFLMTVMDTDSQSSPALQSFKPQARMIYLKSAALLNSLLERLSKAFTIFGGMAPLPRPGNSPSFSLNSGSDSVLKKHPYFLSWGGVGGRGEEGMYYNSHLYNAMQFTKPLHFHQLPWTPRVPCETGIQWFIKLLPGPTTRYQALGLATHQGRVGARSREQVQRIKLQDNFTFSPAFRRPV